MRLRLDMLASTSRLAMPLVDAIKPIKRPTGRPRKRPRHVPLGCRSRLCLLICWNRVFEFC